MLSQCPDIGLSGQEIYAAVSAFNADGIVVTASHNPIDYNGMKIVKSIETLTMPEFTKIKNVAEGNNFVIPKHNSLAAGRVKHDSLY